MYRPWVAFFIITMSRLGAADYLIDDSNTTALQYSVGPSTQVTWGPFGSKSNAEQLVLGLSSGSSLSVDASSCYNKTL
jgi:hypothetical protein